MRRLTSLFGSVVPSLLVAACALGATSGPPSVGAVAPAGKALFEPTKRGQVFHGLGPWRRDNLEHIDLMPPEQRPAFTTVYLNPGDRRAQGDPAWVARGFGQRLAEEHEAGRFVHLGIELQDNTSGKLRPIVREFVEGDEHDELIVLLAEQIKAHGTPVIVRPLFEFNSEKYLDHKVYRAGYRKVVELFREVGVGDTVTFCWCFEPRAGPGRFMDWYPGDDVVDWFGLDIFGEADVFDDPQTRAFLREADRHDRPVFLAEVTCNRVPLGTSKADGKRVIKEWFEPFADFIDDHDQIKGFSYITTDYTKRGKYATAGWGDSRLHMNPTVLEWWIDWTDGKQFVGGVGSRTSWRELSGVEEVLSRR